MTSSAIPAQPARRPGRHVGPGLVLTFALLVTPGLYGCAERAQVPAGWTAAPAHSSPTAMGGTGQPSEAMQAAWAARPAFVRSDPRTEEAYAFALASPEVLKWIPCYCGCAAMGHGSNADCFFKPTREGLSSLTFEEHASACDTCVKTALMAKQMLGQGQSLRAIRNAVDATFGGNGAPGTPTELPPA